jgi:hypothetical protein
MPEYNHWIATRFDESVPFETGLATERAFWKALAHFSMRDGGDNKYRFFSRIVELGKLGMPMY